MACGMYTRVRLDTTPLKMYGFRKVTSEELLDITARIVKPTYSRALYASDRNRPAPLRLPSARCKRAPRDGDSIGGAVNIRLPAPLVEKIVKRMRMPTVSVRAACGEIQPSYEVHDREKPTRPKSSNGGKESYSRPTTASKSRSFCRFCTDPALKDYLQVDYADDNAVEGEELTGIIQRLTTPTQASRLASSGSSSVTRCPRRKPSMDTRIRSDVPLVSGMSRTRSVHEISHRLYSTPTQAIPTRACSSSSSSSRSAKSERRQRLAATPCTM